MEKSSLLTQVVQSLKQHEDSTRIKKLVFYVTKRIWTKDQTQLNSISLTELIRDLITIYSNLESLK